MLTAAIGQPLEASAAADFRGGPRAADASVKQRGDQGTAGQATLLEGGGGSGWIIASADF